MTSDSTDNNPFKKTQGLAGRLMVEAVRTADVTAIEIAKQGVAIFTKCLQGTLEVKHEDAKAAREYLYAATQKAAKDEAAKRITDEFGSLVSECEPDATASDAKAIAEGKKLDQSIVTLHSTMTTACLEFTNKLLTSPEFTEELGALLASAAGPVGGRG
ncbi:MAG: hypothetical protein KGL39_23945 [Patescibacteria group bacterium]|nr:hypothetical protein [Patescibacteria group bacterium]